ncbi:MAG: DsrE family protein [Candidatus Nanopelagicales bacterium]|jgi:predicted peroxiredoxin|nr:DsrE family protein [Candidatus Nanopelagicales bacterium]MCU0294827.1 DsrE family protein [Candidatus Nanopelagicales bacterium]MCU0298720.1 DsrE family protein [Candidatus Nanopelagicales bacterium]
MNRLVVQLTTDEPEKVAAALTVSMAAVASGADVALWLSGPASLLAVPDQAPDVDLEYAPGLEEGLAAPNTVRVCSQCAARRGLRDTDLREGARIGGAMELVEALLTDGTAAVTY